MIIEMHLSIGYSGADHNEEIEVEDSLTEDEIQEIVMDWANNYIEVYWHQKEEE